MIVRAGSTRISSLAEAGVTVLEVRGDIDRDAVAVFTQALQRVATAGLVVDLCACGTMDPRAADAVLARQRRTPATFAIVCTPDAPARRTYLLQLSDAVPVYATREEAIAAVAAREAWSRTVR